MSAQQPCNDVVEAVMIFCNGATKANRENFLEGGNTDFQHARFRAIKIGPQNPIFYEPLSPISIRLNRPLRLIQWATHTPETDVFNYRVNQYATHAMRSLDPASECFGCVPTAWEGPAGNAVVARADKKPLDVDFVRALTEFAGTRMMRMLERRQEGHTTSEQVLAEITQAKFHEFAEEMRHRNCLEGNGSGHRWLTHYRRHPDQPSFGEIMDMHMTGSDGIVAYLEVERGEEGRGRELTELLARDN